LIAQIFICNFVALQKGIERALCDASSAKISGFPCLPNPLDYAQPWNFSSIDPTNYMIYCRRPLNATHRDNLLYAIVNKNLPLGFPIDSPYILFICQHYPLT
jgi:hypothetical protein